MYRTRTAQSKKLAAMRAAKERLRVNGEAPHYPEPRQLPRLRRKVIIIDYDFGEARHEIDLYQTSRIDCYRVIADGQPWRDRIGWSKVLEGLRKSLIRVHAA